MTPKTFTTRQQLDEQEQAVTRVDLDLYCL
jgi:hypothetical protein